MTSYDISSCVCLICQLHNEQMQAFLQPSFKGGFFTESCVSLTASFGGGAVAGEADLDCSAAEGRFTD